tara:strand:+ start:1857 stop:2252 length:396 start_codon:yes stop_codon:yes gene_type:complete
MTDSYEIQLSSTCLMMSVAMADEILEDGELDAINEILTDFFSITSEEAAELIEAAKTKLEKSYDTYSIASTLVDSFSYSDRVDLICCIFEVAYADKDLHFMERHTIKQIASILQIDRLDLVRAKKEIESYL